VKREEIVLLNFCV